MSKAIFLLEAQSRFAESLEKNLEASPFDLTCPKISQLASRLRDCRPYLILLPIELKEKAWKNLSSIIPSFKKPPIIPLIGICSRGDERKGQKARERGLDMVISEQSLLNHPLWQIQLYARPDLEDARQKPLPEGIKEGLRLFNQRKFHESHDAIEPVWLEEKGGVRMLYQGILQLGIAFYLMEKGKGPVSLRMFHIAKLKLRHFLPEFQGIDLRELVEKAAFSEEMLRSLGPQKSAQWDPELYPKINWKN